MMIIGICGKAGAGKDTVADHLVAAHGFVKYSFAKPLKEMLRCIGIDADNRDTKELPDARFGKSPRQMAQTLGTEWMRQMVHKDGWLLCAADYITKVAAWQRRDGEKDIPKAPTGIVIPDVRFENEADFVRNQGGTVWHLERSAVAGVNEHISEAGIADHNSDHYFFNDGTIAYLLSTISPVIRYMQACSK